MILDMQVHEQRVQTLQDLQTQFDQHLLTRLSASQQQLRNAKENLRRAETNASALTSGVTGFFKGISSSSSSASSTAAQEVFMWKAQVSEAETRLSNLESEKLVLEMQLQSLKMELSNGTSGETISSELAMMELRDLRGRMRGLVALVVECVPYGWWEGEKVLRNAVERRLQKLMRLVKMLECVCMKNGSSTLLMTDLDRKLVERCMVRWVREMVTLVQKWHWVRVRLMEGLVVDVLEREEAEAREAEEEERREREEQEDEDLRRVNSLTGSEPGVVEEPSTPTAGSLEMWETTTALPESRETGNSNSSSSRHEMSRTMTTSTLLGSAMIPPPGTLFGNLTVNRAPSPPSEPTPNRTTTTNSHTTTTSSSSSSTTTRLTPSKLSHLLFPINIDHLQTTLKRLTASLNNPSHIPFPSPLDIHRSLLDSLSFIPGVPHRFDGFLHAFEQDLAQPLFGGWTGWETPGGGAAAAQGEKAASKVCERVLKVCKMDEADKGSKEVDRVVGLVEVVEVGMVEVVRGGAGLRRVRRVRGEEEEEEEGGGRRGREQGREVEVAEEEGELPGYNEIDFSLSLS
ncbi:hypothetical protein HDV05_006573 [Chytridiales sp. JEL 0842]|nr:hypothetical protein HDV05_006573 [Chytridiales sp. JEL 0842]